MNQLKGCLIKLTLKMSRIPNKRNSISHVATNAAVDFCLRNANTREYKIDKFQNATKSSKSLKPPFFLFVESLARYLEKDYSMSKVFFSWYRFRNKPTIFFKAKIVT